MLHHPGVVQLLLIVADPVGLKGAAEAPEVVAKGGNNQQEHQGCEGEQIETAWMACRPEEAQAAEQQPEGQEIEQDDQGVASLASHGVF